MDARMKTGLRFTELIWFLTAQRIVEKAIQVYQLDNERAEALRAIYLREADYVVRIRKS